MPPKLALGLCLAFCFYVLYKDSKIYQDVGWSVWLPTLWMMRCSSRSLTLWFNARYSIATSDMDVTGSAYDQLFLGMLMIIGVMLLWQRRDRCSGLFRNNHFLFIFFAYMGISVNWSDDPASLKRWIRTVGDLTMALLVATEDKPCQAMGIIFRRTAYVLIPLSVVLIKYFPDLGRMQAKHWLPNMWIGVATHKNTLGQLCLFSGIVFVWDFLIRRVEKHQALRLPILRMRVDILYGIMLLYLLGGGGNTNSKSTTSILMLGFACGLFLLLVRRHRRGRQIVLFRLASGALFIVMAVYFSLPLFFDRSVQAVVAASQGKDETLAGRTGLWEDLMIMGRRHPILGAGYGGFWTRENRDELLPRHPWGPEQSHNGYIEIWLHLGLVGILFFVLILAQAFRGISSRLQTDFPYGILRLVLLVVTLAHNYSEAGFSRPTHAVWFIFLVAILNVQSAQADLDENAPVRADVAEHWVGREGSVSGRVYISKMHRQCIIDIEIQN